MAPAPSPLTDLGTAGLAGAILALAQALAPLLQVVVLALTVLFLLQGVALRRRALRTRSPLAPGDDLP
jgi:hypothetical protein